MSEFLVRKNVFENEKKIERYIFPFTSFIIDDFLENPKTADTLRKEIFHLLDSTNETRTKDDLSSRKQSQDLKNISGYETLESIRNFFYSEEIFSFMEKECSVSLKREEIDLFCQVYNKGDYLLCHDDMLDQRAIAFILYLVDDCWSVEDGGTLDLYNTDEELNPEKIAMQIVPKKNRFTFFKISSISFHQVSEIIMKNTRIPRTSIIGWYHYKEKIMKKQVYSPLTVFYNIPENIQMLSGMFCINDAPIILENFLLEEFFIDMKNFLSQATWKQKPIPANQGSFCVLEKNTVSSVWCFLQFLESHAFKKNIKTLTGLNIGETVSKITRKYTKGDYEMYNQNRKEPGDVCVVLVLKEKNIVGGDFGFMKKENNIIYENAYYTPKDNNVVIYLCEEGKTVKYIKKNNIEEGSVYLVGVTYSIEID